MPPFSASACAFAASANGITRSTGILNFLSAMSSVSERMLAASGWELKAGDVGAQALGVRFWPVVDVPL